MKIYKYLCDKEFRENLAKFLMEEAPEVLECDINNAPEKGGYLLFKEYNCSREKDTTFIKIPTHEKHYFTLSATRLGDYSSMCYWDKIFEETKLDSFKNDSMGYKAMEGHKYPELDIKVRELIRDYTQKYVREEKLEVILDEG